MAKVFAKSIAIQRDSWVFALLYRLRPVTAGTIRAAIDATPPFSLPRSFLAVFSHRTTGRAASDAIAAVLPILRLILGITLMLWGLGSLSCQVRDSVGDGPNVTPAGRWVRTVDGWERTDLWNAPNLHEPRLHPFVVSAGQVLVSVMGLVACAGDRRSSQRRQQP